MKLQSLLKSAWLLPAAVLHLAATGQGRSHTVLELANKLANPVSGLASLHIQQNLDYGIGGGNGSKSTTDFLSVLPISLGPGLNLITRSVIPVVSEHNTVKTGADQSGMSDASFTAFFSPAGREDGITWGVGPAFRVAMGSNESSMQRPWGLGPAGVILAQSKGFTAGFLMRQIWSFSGDKGRYDVNQLYIQSFITKNYKSGAGIGLSSEITSNYKGCAMMAYLMPTVSAVIKVHRQAISFMLAPRIPVAGIDQIKPEIGLRAGMAFLFAN
jgi:hypothetical protein